MKSYDFLEEKKGNIRGVLGVLIEDVFVLPAKVDEGHFKLDLVRGNMPQSEASQAVLNGKKFLRDRRTLILGLSPGNPYYYSLDVLERLFGFARQNSEKVE